MNHKKLLIADDSELNRAILVNMLEHDFEIIEVSDGKEAIAALESYQGRIAALLLDLVMPEMDSFEVLDEMNRKHWIDTIPTIIISAETNSAYIDRAFRLGVSDYISRPYISSVVRQRIINAILLQTKKQQLMSVVADQFDEQLCRGIPQRRKRHPHVQCLPFDGASAAAAADKDRSIPAES